MTEKSKNEEYAFNAFASLPFYSKINSEFIKLAKIDDKKLIIFIIVRQAYAKY